ncbi:MAG: hypothetical protein LZ172_01370 [Thaumarchaeota archaeon]|nr:hypothetical protein [Candidatus Geocrenenecus arthurdayi]MCL7396899.1 hypothetical protein [Candidatus Geocrenenecus arthurdayi]MCL7402640.1 hypothetical protein [Candidatus Geocrenenecus arthurdayi]MCL7402988.1 hypothetical protein [Candidatus Geocrenenecus arthurdayi]
MSLRSKVKEKVEGEFRELEDRLMKILQDKLKELKEKVRESSRTILG